MKLRYYLGNLLKHLDFHLVRSHKFPKANIDLTKIIFTLLTQAFDRDFTIVQIGAFDGVVADPIQALLKSNFSGRAILVEPQPRAFELLQAKYSDDSRIALENSAITETSGSVTLYVPVSESGSSPMASLLKEHYKNFGIGSHDVECVEVSSISVDFLLKKYEVTEIDLLQIDTEGYDYKILNQFFRAGKYPLIINCETYHLTKIEKYSFRHDLEKLGYQYIDVGFDTFALHASSFTLS